MTLRGGNGAVQGDGERGKGKEGGYPLPTGRECGKERWREGEGSSPPRGRECVRGRRGSWLGEVSETGTAVVCELLPPFLPRGRKGELTTLGARRGVKRGKEELRERKGSRGLMWE